MKTLYISDLDGTLLDNNAEVSEGSVCLLNESIKNGAFFSVATARTSSTVIKMLEKINVNVPIVLMNGVAIYDITSKKYVNVCKFSQKAKMKFLNTLKEYSSRGFIYCHENDDTSTYYQNTDAPNAKEFIREREEKFLKKFTKVNDIIELENKDVIYYSYNDRKENIEPLYRRINEIEGLRCEFYADTYNTDFWYFEVCSVDASKKNAVEFLREKYNFDKIVGFGDNFNDIPLFEACDESCAVNNAKSKVKKSATNVIGENTKDSVAKYVSEKFNEEIGN